jgi:hypothetical protein
MISASKKEGGATLKQTGRATLKRGRTECRVSDAPVVWAKNARVVPQFTGFNRHPCAMVLRFPSCSPQ